MRTLKIVKATRDQFIGQAIIEVREDRRQPEQYIVTRAAGKSEMRCVKVHGSDEYETNLSGRCSCPWGKVRAARPQVKPCRHVAAAAKLVELELI